MLEIISNSSLSNVLYGLEKFQPGKDALDSSESESGEEGDEESTDKEENDETNQRDGLLILEKT